MQPARSCCTLSGVCVFLLSFQSASAFRLLPKSREHPANPTKDHELALPIRQSIGSNAAVYTQALDILSSMQTLPSCHRLSTATLLDSCQSIDGSKPDASGDIDDIRSIYAAQLAMCEISGADSSIPQPCKALAPKGDSKARRHPSKDQISRCLQTLESRPQWWTSYSNNKQNAIVICQAARVDVDKDDLLKLHERMVKAQAMASDALHGSAQVALNELLQTRQDFLRASQDFQEQLSRDIATSISKTRALFEGLVSPITTALGSVLTSLRTMTDTVQSETATMTQAFQSTNRAAEDAETRITKVFNKLDVRTSELATLQDIQSEAGRSFTSELQASLRGIQEGDLGSLTQVLEHIGLQLQRSNQLVNSIHQHQYHVDAQMDTLQKSFTEMESRAANFGAAQVVQADMQSKLQDQMETGVQLALQLRNVITETSAKIESVTALAQTFGAVFDWALIALLGILGALTITFLTAIWRLSRTWFVCVLATMTSFTALHLLWYSSLVAGWF